MPIASLIIRCYLERRNDIWQAFSLEFGLAAQGESAAEVRQKLDQMIYSYVRDAVTVDKEHAKTLLSRRATLQVYAKYYWFNCLSGISSISEGLKNHIAYREPLPLIPSPC